MTAVRLDSFAQTLVFARGEGLPECVYWGAPLPVNENLTEIVSASKYDVTGGMLDELPPLSLSPEAAKSFPGQPGLEILGPSGEEIRPNWQFETRQQTDDRLEFVCRAEGLRIRFEFIVLPEGIISARTLLASEKPVRLRWMAAPVLPGSPRAAEIMEISGRWVGEMRPVRTPFANGGRLREARTGRSGHEHPPHALFLGPGTTNGQGEVHACHYAWSGGHRMVAEELADGRRQIQFGHVSGSQSAPDTSFESATLLLAFGGQGLNSVAVPFQRYFRRIASAQRLPRPVHYNCWEAVYFDHDLETLKQIATRAAELGAERFVLDDGWFERRNDDTSSLGDWRIDKTKYPQGFTPLVEHLQGLGLAFGLWVEPEMVNEDSALFRAHPEWVLGPPDQIRGRHQLCLDLARPDVQEELFRQISALLSDWPIEYLKWDHNRLPPVAEAAQTQSLYALLDRLRAVHPEVEIESCASGGGRIDAGILKRTGRVWLSDSNDALERARIQHEAALFLPASVTGSHVGPRQSHTSGRRLDMQLRAFTAAQRHMGFEMDPRELTPDEADSLRRATHWWKTNREWLMQADILRLDTEPEIIAELQCAPDKSRFVVFSTLTHALPQIHERPLQLTGLDPDALYTVSMLEKLPGISRAPTALAKGELSLSGSWLMHHGLNLPSRFVQTIAVIEGRRQ